MFARSGCSILFAGLVLSGCGTMPGDRAVSGGLLGAGTGAAIGAIAGEAGLGALSGGLFGLAVGALTSPELLNLGPPPWRQTSNGAACTASSSSGACATKEDVHIAQSNANQAVTTSNQAVTTANEALTTAHTAASDAQAALHRSGQTVRVECVRWSPATGECVRTAPRYATVARADTVTANWIVSCARRFRSFDPASGTYLGYDGHRHACH
jgi:osmotically inducible lipoprotein OsmB